MEGKAKTGISPTRAEDFAQWFQSVVRDAEVAELDHVRGCMVIRPWGYGIWELMQRALDDAIKETGAVNAYFPLFIPLSYFEEEAKHVEGFAKEMAVVTHHRLEQGDDGSLHPAAELPEPLVVRPTSETIIGRSFAKWINSYRDLPLLINQWATSSAGSYAPECCCARRSSSGRRAIRPMRPSEEAREETSQDARGLPRLRRVAARDAGGGRREARVRALPRRGDHAQHRGDDAGRQGASVRGTSHYLGENFAGAMEMEFTDEDGERKLCHTTSWGLTTRMIGAVVMTHGDDNGLRAASPRSRPARSDRPDHAGRSRRRPAGRG